MAKEAAWEDDRPDRVVGRPCSAMNPCQLSKTHTRTEPEAGPDTLGVDEKAASWKGLIGHTNLSLRCTYVAQESDALVVGYGCGPVWRDAWNLYLKGPGLALYLSPSEVVGAAMPLGSAWSQICCPGSVPPRKDCGPSSDAEPSA